MEFIAGMFVGWGTLPILILAIEMIIIFGCVEYERGEYAILSGLVFGGILYFFFDINLLRSFVENPFFAVVYAVAYIGLGVVYSLIRWNHFGAQWRENYDEAVQEKNIRGQEYLLHNPPRSWHNKNRIVTWSMFWPWSGVWFFIGRFVKRLKDVFVWIYHRLGKVYDRISARHTKGIEGLAD